MSGPTNYDSQGLEMFTEQRPAVVQLADLMDYIHEMRDLYYETQHAIQVASSFKYYASVKEYGAKGDGTTNDRKAFQDTIDSLVFGGIVHVPKGNYKISKNPSADYGIKISKPIIFIGEGFSTVIRADESMGNSDVIFISPNMDFGGEFYSIQRMLIYPLNPSYGRDAIKIDVSQPTQYMSKFYMSDVYIQQHGRYAIHVNNAENKADGFFASTFERNTLYGGVKMNRSGDSIIFRDCTVTGERRGFDVKSVSLPQFQNFASQFILDNCNITSKGGAVKVDFAKNMTIIGGNIEQTHLLNGHVIDVSGIDQQVTNFTIERTHVTVFGESGSGCNTIRLDNVKNAFLKQLSVANETGGINILVDSNAKNINLSDISYEGGTNLIVNTPEYEVYEKNKPALSKVKRLTNLSIPHNTVLYVPFENVEIDSCLSFKSENNTRLTCKKTGIYRITGSVTFSGESVAGRRMMAIQYNRTKDIANSSVAPVSQSGVNTVLNTETIFKMEKGDYIELTAYQSSGDTINLIANDYSNNLSMTMISE